MRHYCGGTYGLEAVHAVVPILGAVKPVCADVVVLVGLWHGVGRVVQYHSGVRVASADGGLEQ